MKYCIEQGNALLQQSDELDEERDGDQAQWCKLDTIHKTTLADSQSTQPDRVGFQCDHG